MPTTAILLLAAGNSSRLGRPKQLLPCSRGTLLRHAAQTALDAMLGPLVVVLGAIEPECREALLGMTLTIAPNPQWEQGMGTSISTGMQRVRECEHASVIIMLCDQPAISPGTLRTLVNHQQGSGCSIVASRHGEDGTLGPPALFTARHFSQLRLLKGHEGARTMFHQQPPGELDFVPCPEAALDVDTEADLIHLERF